MTEHVDEDLLAELAALMEDDFGLLLQTYLTESANQFAAARTALARGDMVALRHSVHSVKGSSLNIGAHALSKLCEQLEAHAQADRPAAVARLLEPASAELEAVQAEVRNLYQHSQTQSAGNFPATRR